MGWDGILSLLPYGDKFRKQRRMFQYFNPQVVHRLRSIQEAELYTLLDDVLTSPENFSMHINRYVMIVYIVS